MSPLIEVASAQALNDLLSSNSAVCVTFSAHWCGPCKASKPQLEQLAQEYESRMKMAIVYESDLGESIHEYRIRAFPTYVLFVHSKEQERVQGVNLVAVKSMMDNVKVTPQWNETQGATLGGGSNATALTPEQARMARLAKLGGASTITMGPSLTEEIVKEEPEKTAAVESTSEPMDTEDSKPESTLTEIESNAAKEEEDMQKEAERMENNEALDPTANLDKDALETLTEAMGFSLLRAQKGLLYGTGGTVNGAVDWLAEHQDDDDIDDPIPANTVRAVPRTPEEKAAKIAEIKELLRAKRAEREEAEKVVETDREKQRRLMGQEMLKTKEQLEMEQRKREAYLRKKEKEDFKRERARLRAELAKDKADRQANHGKLASKLGVEGYNPDGIQYDVEMDNAETAAAAPATAELSQQEEQQSPPPKPRSAVDVAKKIDECIHKVSQYRAGGDGGSCLKVLKVYVGNALDHPTEPKYRSINTENKGFKTKVKPFIGAKQLLMTVGFQPPEGSKTAGTLVLSDPIDYPLLATTKAKLEAAIIAFG